MEKKYPFLSPLLGLRNYPYRLGLLLLLVVLGITFLKPERQRDWDRAYLPAAHHLRAGEDIYRLEDGYLYPPITAWLLTPFSFLSQAHARLAWFTVNAVGVVLLLRWAWRLSGGGALEGARTIDRREHLVCLLGLMCGLRFILDCLYHHQTDVLVGALVLGGCLALRGKRLLLAATCLGFAAGIKCTPLLWAVYLAWRRQWWVAAWLVGVALGVNLLPNLANAPEQGGWWLEVWFQRYLLPMREASHFPGTWGSCILMNQSLAGASFRWFITDWNWTAKGIEIVTRTEVMSAGALKVILYGTEAILLLAAAFLLGRRPSVPAQKGETTHQSLEYSVVLLLMVLLSPMSGKPHFWIMLLPGFCLARQALKLKHFGLWTLLLTSLTLNVLSIQGLVGSDLADIALWYGFVTGSALVLLMGCALALRLNNLTGNMLLPIMLPKPQRQPSPAADGDQVEPHAHAA